MAAPSIEIKFLRPNKTYYEGDVVTGSIAILTKNECKHEGIWLQCEGAVVVSLSPQNAGVLESLTNATKSLELTSSISQLDSAGRLTGKRDFPIEIPLKPKSSARPLYETYHGVALAIQYSVKVIIKRTFPNKDIEKAAEFIVETKPNEESANFQRQPLEFHMTPEKTHMRDRAALKLPKFSIKGRLDSTVCKLNEPFTGEITVDQCGMAIRSIDLQLMRVETCGGDHSFSKESSEIQSIQVADGDVARNLPIPLYMIFPRLFSCPTLETSQFKIELEVNVIIVFENDYLISDTVPVKLLR